MTSKDLSLRIAFGRLVVRADVGIKPPLGEFRERHNGRRVVASATLENPPIPAGERGAHRGLELRSILRDARLPLRLLRPLLDAHAKEPLPNAFGVSQALTLAAQSLSPEERFELERAAGRYLTQTN